MGHRLAADSRDLHLSVPDRSFILNRTANSVTVTSTYDASGNRLAAGDGRRTITTYDRRNRPLTVAASGDSGAGTTYTYSLTSPTWTDPSGTYMRRSPISGRAGSGRS